MPRQCPDSGADAECLPKRSMASRAAPERARRRPTMTLSPPSCRGQPRRAAGFRTLPNAQDVALTLRHRNDAARIEQIEDVTGLNALVIGWQRQLVMLVVGSGLRRAGLQQRLALHFGVAEVSMQDLGVGKFEVVARIFLLGLQKHIAVGELACVSAAVEVEVEYAVHALHVHSQALQAIGDLA